MSAITLYLGLDVHKDSVTLAIAQGTPQGEIHLHGTITNDLHALEKALSRIRKAHGGAPLHVAYEAGPCGFGIARRLQQLAVPGGRSFPHSPAAGLALPNRPTRRLQPRPAPARRRTHRRLCPQLVG